MPQQFCSRRLDETTLPTDLTDAFDALRIIDHVRHDPPRDQAIALLLDGRRGRAVVVVDGCHESDHPDAVLTVVDRLAAASAHADQHVALVLATMRDPVEPDDIAVTAERDRELWRSASDLAEQYGCELVEWFVMAGHLVWCPRSLAGEPPRW